MQKVYFKEEQQFDQLWLRLFFLLLGIGVTVTFACLCYWQLVKGIPLGDKPMSNEDLIVISIIMVISIWIPFFMFLLARLTMVITSEGLFVKFPPFSFKTTHINRESIERYEIRKYNAIMEYGGYGSKDSMRRKSGKAFIVKGNQGLQLFLNDGKKILLGTQKPDSLKLAMGRMMEHDQNE
jgi:hypothetical protein